MFGVDWTGLTMTVRSDVAFDFEHSLWDVKHFWSIVWWRTIHWSNSQFILRFQLFINPAYYYRTASSSHFTTARYAEHVYVYLQDQAEKRSQRETHSHTLQSIVVICSAGVLHNYPYYCHYRSLEVLMIEYHNLNLLFGKSSSSSSSNNRPLMRSGRITDRSIKAYDEFQHTQFWFVNGREEKQNNRGNEVSEVQHDADGTISRSNESLYFDDAL